MDRKLLVLSFLVFLVICFDGKKADSKKNEEYQLEKERKELVISKRATDVSNAEYIYNRSKKTTKSKATYYGPYPGGGACALDPLSPLSKQPGWITVAAGKDDFQTSLGCGMCVEITGSGKGSGLDPVTGVTKAIVHDLCETGFDLFITGDGVWEIESKAIDCPTVPGENGNIMFRFTGSNPWYVKLQARNTKLWNQLPLELRNVASVHQFKRVPVAGMEILKKDGKYSCLKRTTDNYFTGDGLGTVSFPMKVRVTAVTGEQKEAVLPKMLNDDNIPTKVQFGGFAVGPGAASIKCAGQGNKSPYPPGGMAGEGGGPSAPLPAPGPPPPPPPPAAPAPPTGNAAGGVAAGSDFCINKESGTYANPADCAGFIICNNGDTFRQSCAPPLLLRADTFNCDLPNKVDCGTRPILNRDARPRIQLADTYGAHLKPLVRPFNTVKGQATSPHQTAAHRISQHESDSPIQRIPPYEINMRLEKDNRHAVLYKTNDGLLRPAAVTLINTPGEGQGAHAINRPQWGRGNLKYGGPIVGNSNKQAKTSGRVITIAKKSSKPTS